MIQWVFERAVSSNLFDLVVVATDSRDIKHCVEGFGGVAELTGTHATGTDRVAEVAQRYPDMDLIANVQGDQPFLTSEQLVALVNAPRSDWQIHTLGCPLRPSEVSNPNVVKVIRDHTGRVLYFSRAPIPFGWTGESDAVLRHLGVYLFTAPALESFTSLVRGSLELAEGLEQLRALENGWSIHVTASSEPIVDVNTPEDLSRANEVADTLQEGSGHA